jgi:hypothetical protein
VTAHADTFAAIGWSSRLDFEQALKSSGGNTALVAHKPFIMEPKIYVVVITIMVRIGNSSSTPFSAQYGSSAIRDLPFVYIKYLGDELCCELYRKGQAAWAGRSSSSGSVRSAIVPTRTNRTASPV